MGNELKHGRYKCPKCKFYLVVHSLNINSGQMGSDTTPNICPNDGTFMEPVTLREYCKELEDTIEHLMSRPNPKENLMIEFNKAISYLKNVLNYEDKLECGSVKSINDVIKIIKSHVNTRPKNSKPSDEDLSRGEDKFIPNTKDSKELELTAVKDCLLKADLDFHKMLCADDEFSEWLSFLAKAICRRFGADTRKELDEKSIAKLVSVNIRHTNECAFWVVEEHCFEHCFEHCDCGVKKASLKTAKAICQAHKEGRI